MREQDSCSAGSAAYLRATAGDLLWGRFVSIYLKGPLLRQENGKSPPNIYIKTNNKQTKQQEFHHSFNKLAVWTGRELDWAFPQQLRQSRKGEDWSWRFWRLVEEKAVKIRKIK